ncbi:MAG: hypothetical protein WCC01_06395 [Acidimicrobiia bacterium]
MDAEPIREEIAEFHRGKKWIIVPDVAAGATPLVDQMREWEPSGIMIVAAVEGVGDLPKADRIRYTRAVGDTVMLGIRASNAAIENPDPDLLAAIDDFDPEHEALVLGPGFSREATLVGRPVYGARPKEWWALEDKTIVDQLWDDAGVRRSPATVVPVAEAPAAAADLASDLGTVWVADNSEGWHGGGEYARWVRSADEVAPALAWFAKHALEVRVMPFLDGIPCSIHGFVTRDGVAVFRPIEMVILRDAVRPEFVYAQAANYWNPPASVQEAMRAAARGVGHLLSDRYGYLGGFGIDGVCTVDGFLPTELNPRLSIGHGLHSRAADMPLGAMERMQTEGDLEVDAAALEETLLTAAINSRRGGLLLPLTGEYAPDKTGVRFVDGRAVAVDPEDECDATMEIGGAMMGSIIIVRLDPDRTPVGPSIAPRAVAMFALARDLWNLDIPEMAAAPDVCAGA